MNPEFWNARYKEQAFAYGKTPNQFFKTQLENLPAGKILLPAEGEGRNAVFAAEEGWEVVAFDTSEEGKNKALLLASEKGVPINYLVSDWASLDFQENEFDAIGLVYAHIPQRNDFYMWLDRVLKPGGKIILEGFSDGHLAYREQNPKIGGPGVLELLFSEEEIETAFDDYYFNLLEDTEVELSEGLYHNGIGKVLRGVFTKP